MHIKFACDPRPRQIDPKNVSYLHTDGNIVCSCKHP